MSANSHPGVYLFIYGKAKLAKLAHAVICLRTLGSYFYDTRLVGSADAYGRTVLGLETV